MSKSRFGKTPPAKTEATTRAERVRQQREEELAALAAKLHDKNAHYEEKRTAEQKAKEEQNRIKKEASAQKIKGTIANAKARSEQALSEKSEAQRRSDQVHEKLQRETIEKESKSSQSLKERTEAYEQQAADSRYQSTAEKSIKTAILPHIASYIVDKNLLGGAKVSRITLEKRLVTDLANLLIPLAIIIQKEGAKRNLSDAKISEEMSGTLKDALELMLDINKKQFAQSRTTTMLQNAGLSKQDILLFTRSINTEMSNINHVVQHIQSVLSQVNNNIALRTAEKLQHQADNIKLQEEIEKHLLAVKAASTTPSKKQITALLTRTNVLLSELQKDIALQHNQSLLNALLNAQVTLNTLDKTFAEAPSETAVEREADKIASGIDQFIVDEFGDTPQSVVTSGKIQDAIDNPDSLLEGFEGTTTANSTVGTVVDSAPVTQTDEAENEYEDDFDTDLTTDEKFAVIPPAKDDDEYYADDFVSEDSATNENTTQKSENNPGDAQDSDSKKVVDEQDEIPEDISIAAQDEDEPIIAAGIVETTTAGSAAETTVVNSTPAAPVTQTDAPADESEDEYKDDFDTEVDIDKKVVGLPPATDDEEYADDFVSEDSATNENSTQKSDDNPGDEQDNDAKKVVDEQDEIPEDISIASDDEDEPVIATEKEEIETVVDNTEEEAFKASLANSIQRSAIASTSIDAAKSLYNKLQQMHREAVSAANAGNYSSASEKFWSIVAHANTTKTQYQKARENYAEVDVINANRSTALEDEQKASGVMASQANHFSHFYAEIAKNQAAYGTLTAYKTTLAGLTDESTVAKMQEKITTSKTSLSIYQQLHNTETAALKHLTKTADQPHYNDIIIRYNTLGSNKTALETDIRRLENNVSALQNIHFEEKRMNTNRKEEKENDNKADNVNPDAGGKKDEAGAFEPPIVHKEDDNEAVPPPPPPPAGDDDEEDQALDDAEIPKPAHPLDLDLGGAAEDDVANQFHNNMNQDQDDFIPILDSPSSNNNSNNKTNVNSNSAGSNIPIKSIDQLDQQLTQALARARKELKNLKGDYSDISKAHRAYSAVSAICDDIQAATNNPNISDQVSIIKNMADAMTNALSASQLMQADGNQLGSVFKDEIRNFIQSAKDNVQVAYKVADKSGIGLDYIMIKYNEEDAFVRALAKPALQNVLAQADAAKELGHIKALTSHLAKYKMGHVSLINDNAQTRKTLHEEWDNKFQPLQDKIIARQEKLILLEEQLKQLQHFDKENENTIGKKLKQVQEALAYCKSALDHLNTIGNTINETRLSEKRDVDNLTREIAQQEEMLKYAKPNQMQAIKDEIADKKRELAIAQDALNNLMDSDSIQDTINAEADPIRKRQLEYARNDRLVELTADTIELFKRSDYDSDTAFNEAVKKAQVALIPTGTLSTEANIGNAMPNRTYGENKLVDFSTQTAVISIKNLTNPAANPTVVTFQRSTESNNFNVTVNSIDEKTDINELRELAMKLVEKYINEQPGKRIYISGKNEKLKEEMRAYCDVMKERVKDPIEKAKYERYPDDFSIKQKIVHKYHMSMMKAYIDKAGIDLVHGKNVYSHKRGISIFGEQFENRKDAQAAPPPPDTVQKVGTKMDEGNTQVENTRSRFSPK